MCFRCGNSRCGGCNNHTQFVSQCSPCQDPGPCPLKLDTQCVIYHKDNNTLTGLVNLGLGNGATLQLILDTIDTYIGQIKASEWLLPCLRAVPFTINTLQQFGQAVDTQLCLLQQEIDTLAGEAATPLVVIDTFSINLTNSGTLGHHLQADVRVSAIAGNQLSIVADGVVVTPQTLSINYTDKTLSISDGNTVDFSSLVCGVGGFLGNVTSDPTAADGQYWYRTDLSANAGLRIKLNGNVKTITLT